MPKINFGQEQVIEAFIYQMVVDKGLLQEDKKQNGKIQHELREQLDEAVQMALIEALPEPRLKELDQALKSGVTDEQIMQFFQNAGVNYPKVAAAAMAKFRQEYLSSQANTQDSQANMPNGQANFNVAEPQAGANTVNAQSTVLTDQSGTPINQATSNSAQPNAPALNNTQPNTPAAEQSTVTAPANQSMTSTNDNLLNQQPTPTNNADPAGETNR